MVQPIVSSYSLPFSMLSLGGIDHNKSDRFCRENGKGTRRSRGSTKKGLGGDEMTGV